MDRFNDPEAYSILDELIRKHTNQEAWDDREHEWLVYCEECGEILDYGVRLKDLEDDPWSCQDLQKLERLLELISGD